MEEGTRDENLRMNSWRTNVSINDLARGNGGMRSRRIKRNGRRRRRRKRKNPRRWMIPRFRPPVGLSRRRESNANRFTKAETVIREYQSTGGRRGETSRVLLVALLRETEAARGVVSQAAQGLPVAGRWGAHSRSPASRFRSGLNY